MASRSGTAPILGAIAAALAAAAAFALALEGESGGIRRVVRPTPASATATPVAEEPEPPQWVEVPAGGALDFGYDHIVRASGGVEWRLNQRRYGDPSAGVVGWTPDGRALVLSVRNGAAFFYAGVPGSGLSLILPFATGAGEIVWSPDGGQLAVVGRKDGADQQLEVLDAESLEILARLGDPHGGFSGWSASGQFLLVNLFEDKYVIWDWISGSSQELPASRAAWSNNGALLAYIPQPDSGSRDRTRFDVRVKDVASDDDLLIGTAHTATPGFLSWSADDSTVSLSITDADGHRTLLFNTRQGGPPVAVTGSYAQSWAPSGSQLAFVGNWCSTFDIFTFSGDGANLVNHTRSEAAGLWPRWSPDGSKIACTGYSAERVSITVIDLDTASFRVVAETPLGPSLSVRSWSPDGQYLVVYDAGGRGLCEGGQPETTTVELLP